MIGSNVPTVGGLPIGFRYGDKWKCECIQIYTTPSRTWQVPNLSNEKINEFKTAWQQSSVKQVVAHVPFLVNLSSYRDDVRENSIKRLSVEIIRAVRLGISYLVLHPGSHGNANRKVGIERIINALRSVTCDIDDPFKGVLLETMAGQGTMIGSSFEEIAYILDKMETSDSIGVCFDTAHVFESGYNLRGYEGYMLTMEEFDKTIGIENVKAIHVNDSKTDLGSRVDRHTNVGEGKMGLQVFHAIVRDPRFSEVPKILEIPERDQKSEKSLMFMKKLREQETDIPESNSYGYQLKLSL